MAYLCVPDFPRTEPVERLAPNPLRLEAAQFFLVLADVVEELSYPMHRRFIHFCRHIRQQADVLQRVSFTVSSRQGPSLVTEDKEIHRKAERLTIAHRVRPLNTAVGILRDLFDERPIPPSQSSTGNARRAVR